MQTMGWSRAADQLRARCGRNEKRWDSQNYFVRISSAEYAQTFRSRERVVAAMLWLLHHSTAALLPASAADPKRHLRAALIESRGDPTTLPAKEAIAALVALRPPAPPACADRRRPISEVPLPGIGRHARLCLHLPVSRAGRLAARVPVVLPRPASARLASLSQEWRPLERSSEWSLLSRPDLPDCLGRDKRGRYGYLFGSLGSELFQPLSLPIVVTDVHTFVGGPVSNFWLHGRDDDDPAGTPAIDGPARRQYAEIVEFEVSGRNVDRALAPRGHFPGNEPVRGVLERRGEAWHDDDPLHPRTLHVSAYSSSLLRPAVGLLDVEEESPVWWQLFGPQEPAGLRDMRNLRDVIGLRRAARSVARSATRGAAHARVMDRDGALRGAARPRRVAVEVLFEDEDLRVARRVDGGVTVAERRGGAEPA